MPLSVLNVDLADVLAQPDRNSELITTLAWGDAVEVEEVTAGYVRISTVRFEKKPDGSIVPAPAAGYICPPKSSGIKTANLFIPREQNKVLKVNFVDVQQGDGSVIESPDGKIILVDGGDNQLFARYLAARFRGSSETSPQPVDCILVTHGDADHFSGLTEIYKSETHADPLKRLFIAPERVYHNGLVKRPSSINGKSVPEKDMLGTTVKSGKDTIITGLNENLLEVPDKEMNKNFLAWKKALAVWNKRKPVQVRRLSFGDDKAFDFFNKDNLKISVLGPFLTEKGNVRGLKFLGAPPTGPRTGHESMSTDTSAFKGLSASHTINGQSVVFQLKYGACRYLFTGDLNDEASRTLASRHISGEISLESEIFKVPHHGSADFSGAFLKCAAPVASIVSSGDESAKKEYIHPRASLMGALGRHARVEEPLIFVTELAAFFNVEGWSRLTDTAEDKERGPFFAFSRIAYGIVKTRTDGKRLLIYCDSGKADLKEAYCYTLEEGKIPEPASVIKV
ncbi:MAG: ComEC/Rec2 family competence protein [Bacteroidota bacterium]